MMPNLHQGKPAPQQQGQRSALKKSGDDKGHNPFQHGSAVRCSFVTTPATVVLWVNHQHQGIVLPTSGNLSFLSWLDGASPVITIEESSKVPQVLIDAYHYGEHALAMSIDV
jgi:hypothetical protein